MAIFSSPETNYDSSLVKRKAIALPEPAQFLARRETLLKGPYETLAVCFVIFVKFSDALR